MSGAAQLWVLTLANRCWIAPKARILVTGAVYCKITVTNAYLLIQKSCSQMMFSLHGTLHHVPVGAIVHYNMSYADVC